MNDFSILRWLRQGVGAVCAVPPGPAFRTGLPIPFVRPLSILVGA